VSFILFLEPCGSLYAQKQVKRGDVMDTQLSLGDVVMDFDERLIQPACPVACPVAVAVRALCSMVVK
jgi:hypothetical protein